MFKTKREKQLEALIDKIWAENVKQMEKNNNRQAYEVNKIIRLFDLTK